MQHVIDRAVVNHEVTSKEGLLERAFAFAFRGLVYAQIWEIRWLTWRRWRSRRIVMS